MSYPSCNGCGHYLDACECSRSIPRVTNKQRMRIAYAEARAAGASPVACDTDRTSGTTCDDCRAANNARNRYVAAWACHLAACLRDAGMLTESARRAGRRYTRPDFHIEDT